MRVLLHDPTGSLQPHKAEELVGALAEASGLPVGIYVQGAGGSALAATLAAARAGAQLIACAIFPLALTLHRVSGRGARRGARRAWASTPASTSRRSGRPPTSSTSTSATSPSRRSRRASPSAPPSTTCPAGLVAGVDATLRAQGAGDRLEEVLEELDRDPRRGRLAAARGADRPGARLAGAAQRALREPLPRRSSTSCARSCPGIFGEPPEPIDPAVQRAVELTADPDTRGGRRRAAERAPRAGGGHRGERGGAAPARALRRGRRAAAAQRSAAARARTRSELAGVDKARAERIRELVRIVQESGIGEVTIEEDGMRVSVRSTAEAPARGAGIRAARAAASRRAAAGRAPVERARRASSRRWSARSTAPPSPGSPPFVEVGDVVAAGPDALHPRGDEADERGQVRARGGRRARSTSRTRSRSSSGSCCSSSSRSSPAPARRASDVRPSPRREPRRDRRARHPRAARARRRGGRRLLDRRRGRAARPARRPRRAHRPAVRGARATCTIPAIVAAATTTGCDAVHPGYGFLSENADFVAACEDNDLVFIGPPADVMERMGDKARAKARDARGGRAARPRHRGRATLAEARAAAEELGYPVLLKAAAGGGGRGMRLVAAPAELDDAYSRRVAEAEAAFGDGDALRREGDHAGAARRDPGALRRARQRPARCGERECSIQRRHQKLIEESPSPGARRRRCARRWRRPRSARAGTSATATPARSSSSSAPTARSRSSS